MTTKVRVKVANEHKKSFIEYNTWQCKLQYLKEEVEGDEDELEVANQVQLEEGATWIVMRVMWWDTQQDVKQGSHLTS